MNIYNDYLESLSFFLTELYNNLKNNNALFNEFNIQITSLQKNITDIINIIKKFISIKPVIRIQPSKKLFPSYYYDLIYPIQDLSSYTTQLINNKNKQLQIKERQKQFKLQSENINKISDDINREILYYNLRIPLTNMILITKNIKKNREIEYKKQEIRKQLSNINKIYYGDLSNSISILINNIDLHIQKNKQMQEINNRIQNLNTIKKYNCNIYVFNNKIKQIT
jgi:hypothetical protein